MREETTTILCLIFIFVISFGMAYYTPEEICKEDCGYFLVGYGGEDCNPIDSCMYVELDDGQREIYKIICWDECSQSEDKE